MRIIFPEFHNPIIEQALAKYSDLCTAATPSQLRPSEPYSPIEAIPAPDLAAACNLLKSGAADTMIAGIDYSSRDVILACRDSLGLAASTFSGLAVMHREGQTYLLADMAACKHPTEPQMLEIVSQTIASATKILPDLPRVALLSFSTNGSGGKDETISLMQSTLAHFQTHPSIYQTNLAKSLSLDQDFFIDGEMQLDAAVNPTVAAKKFPDSPVAGQANVLIAPDLNSGNLIYKAFEQIASFTVAGPILQGFNFPVSDLSRGSTVDDVILTIEAMTLLAA